MSLNDPLSNILSTIQNAEKVGKKNCVIFPVSKLAQDVFKIFQAKHFIGELVNIEGSESYRVNLLGQINKCGVIKPRFSVKVDEFDKFEKRFLPARDFGVLILSTSQGIMTNNEAKEKKIGGKLIAYCY